MSRLRHDVDRLADERLTPRGVKLGKLLRDQRDVAGSDLEETVAAERETPPALQIQRLGLGHRAEEGVGAVENPSIRGVCHRFDLPSSLAWRNSRRGGDNPVSLVVKSTDFGGWRASCLPAAASPAFVFPLNICRSI